MEKRREEMNSRTSQKKIRPLNDNHLDMMECGDVAVRGGWMFMGR